MALTRRNLLLSLAAWTIGVAKSAAEERAGKRVRPLVGALRWDAWYVPGSEQTSAVQRSLSPRHYRWRLPFFAREDVDDRVTMPALSQELMDLEIEQAVYAGLDYWAFVAYPRESPMSVALRQYLDSSAHRRIRFCMFTQFEYWGTARQPTAMIDEHIALMLNDAYVRVEQGRPLYFLGFVTESKVIERWGSLRGLRAQIDRFRARAVATGAGNPYIVLGGSPRDGKGWAPALGGDAIGAYTIAEGRAVGDFAALTRVAEAGWQTMAGSGLTVVPTVMAGWDRRPRVETPVPWEKSQRPGAGIEYHFTAPTPQELMVHLRQALDWVRSQPTGRQAPAVLIYAWNENDEGGWLVPTVPCDQRRLQALHGVLAHGMQIPQPGCSIVR